MRSIHRSIARIAATAAVLHGGVLLGCGDAPPVAPAVRPDTANLYWSLDLSHHAVNLSTTAPYDTLRIVATPRDAHGSVLAGFPAPVYTSSDRDRVDVSPDGVVQALAPASGVNVVARLTVNNLTHVDTVVVNVASVAPPPVLGGLAVVADSARVALGAFLSLYAQTTDTAGASIPGLAVYFATSDPQVATIDRRSGMITTVRPGQVTFRATTTAYGITKTDSLAVRVGAAAYGGVSINTRRATSGGEESYFDPAVVTIGVGGTVMWANNGATPTDVTFDEPTAIGQSDYYCAFVFTLCGAGDIPEFPDATDSLSWLPGVRARAFPSPGRYTFRSARLGITGTVVVVGEQ